MAKAHAERERRLPVFLALETALRCGRCARSSPLPQGVRGAVGHNVHDDPQGGVHLATGECQDRAQDRGRPRCDPPQSLGRPC